MTHPNVFDLHKPAVVAQLRSPEVYKDETDFAIIRVSDTENGEDALCLIKKSRYEDDLAPLVGRLENIRAVAECHANGELEIDIRDQEVAIDALAILAACAMRELRLDPENYHATFCGAIVPEEKFQLAYQHALAA